MKRLNTFSEDSQLEDEIYPVPAAKRLRHGGTSQFESKADRGLAIKPSNTKESL